MRILFVGDIVGRPGRTAISTFLPRIKRELRADWVIANGENAAHGNGLTPSTMKELFESGIDVITSGNHIWDKRDIYELLDTEPRLLRPANYPAEVPGHGVFVTEIGNPPVSLAVINLEGRAFMPPIDEPIRAVDELLSDLPEKSIVFVDFHAETTSEKLALGFFLDGRVSALVGTHTHVQTSDARILPKGTAYLTDVGMTGPYYSVLGVKPEIIIARMRTDLPQKFELSEGAVEINACVVEVDEKTRQAVSPPEIFRRVVEI